MELTRNTCDECGQDMSGEGFDGHYSIVCHKPSCLEVFSASATSDALRSTEDILNEEMSDWGGPERKIINGLRDAILIRLRSLTPASIRRDADLRELEVRKALEDVVPIVEFYLKREIESPSNHQEFAREADEKLRRFRAAIEALRREEKS